MSWSKLALSVILAANARAQQPSLDRILEQVNQLQRDNQRMSQELDALRRQLVELQGQKATENVTEKLDILNQRVEDLAGTKVEADQKFPLRLSGLVLMNSYYYAGHTGGAELPLVAQTTPSQRAAGGTFRNTQVAFLYSGP